MIDLMLHNMCVGSLYAPVGRTNSVCSVLPGLLSLLIFFFNFVHQKGIACAATNSAVQKVLLLSGCAVRLNRPVRTTRG